MSSASSSTELDYARKLVGSAVYAPSHYLDIITLACAVTHKIDDLFTAPRILFLGEKGSGKSNALTVAHYLSANAEPVTGVLAMTAPSYVADFRLNPKCTHVMDEINHLFGQAGQSGKNSKFYTYINQGYRRDTAYAQMQENKTTLRIPIFGVVFMAGLGLACPPDMRERSVIIKMQVAGPKVEVADFSAPETRGAFLYGGRMLKSWAERQPRLSTESIRGLHPKLVHRNMDVWGGMFAGAKLAGGEWPDRILTAFERVQLDAGNPIYAPEDQVLADYLKFCGMYDVSEGVPSGQFAQFAYDQDHGAYFSMKPGQFRQFAVGILGPTTPFYDSDAGKMVRGWTDIVHRMNHAHAESRMSELDASPESTSDDVVWEDF
jgi:hypothetical protein